ncbi:MAG: hypothetical protein HY365_03930 [Candidatus Aenigmarchaeota archaeon]|nr:hypothetical protein [Candidatus Aenigmarchaeota archaeon]
MTPMTNPDFIMMVNKQRIQTELEKRLGRHLEYQGRTPPCDEMPEYLYFAAYTDEAARYVLRVSHGNTDVFRFTVDVATTPDDGASLYKYMDTFTLKGGPLTAAVRYNDA